jgi:hypothetical protein
MMVYRGQLSRMKLIFYGGMIVVIVISSSVSEIHPALVKNTLVI